MAGIKVEDMPHDLSSQPPEMAHIVTHGKSVGSDTTLDAMTATVTIVVPDNKPVVSMTAAELRSGYTGKTPSKRTVDMFIDNIAEKEKDVRTRTRWIGGLMAALLGMALLTTAMALSTYAIVENSKESHVKQSILQDLDGNAVATSNVFSYASLFDLPQFDSRTLAHVKSLTLILEQGDEVTLSVTGAVKHHNSRTVTFLTPSGNKVVVDAGTMIAAATIGGKTRTVRRLPQQSRLLRESNFNIAQLYSEAEFFTESTSRVQRRLAQHSGHGGWAMVALQAGRALLDSFGNESHDSVHLIGEVEVLSGPGVGMRLTEEIYYEQNGEAHKVKVTNSDGSSQLTDFLARAIFRFSSDGTLTECKTPTNFPARDDVAQVGDAVVSQQGNLIQGIADSSVWLLQVTTKTFDVGSTSIPTPTLLDCIEAQRSDQQNIPRLADRQLRNLRAQRPHPKFRRLGDGQLEPALLWELAFPGSYKWKDPVTMSGVDNIGGGWRIHETVEVQNAHAVFLTDGASWVLGIAGTNPQEGDDIAHDLDTSTACQNGIDGQQMCFHKGFLDHANLLADKVNEIKLSLEATGIQLDYVLGHSLGGAAAMIYTQVAMQGLPPKHGVVTFGAPKTRADGSADACEVETYPTVRYSHVQDPVGSSAFTWLDGLPSWLGGSLNFKDFEHDASDAIKLEEVCTKWCWSIFWGVYEKRMSTYDHCHDETGFGGISSAFGVLTHLAYGEYLTRDVVDQYCTESDLPGCGHKV